MRHTGHDTQNDQDASSHEQRRGIGQLGRCLFCHGLRGGHTGHDDGSRQRQKQRWNLRHQTITDGQQCIDTACFAER